MFTNVLISVGVNITGIKWYGRNIGLVFAYSVRVFEQVVLAHYDVLSQIATTIRIAISVFLQLFSMLFFKLAFIGLIVISLQWGQTGDDNNISNDSNLLLLPQAQTLNT